MVWRKDSHTVHECVDGCIIREDSAWSGVPRVFKMREFSQA